MAGFAWMVGDWRCPITATRALHLEITMTGDTLVIVNAVDGMQGRPAEVIHWDPVGHHYVEVYNGDDTTTSDGWQGDRLVFAGGMAGTAGAPVRYVTIKRSARELEERVEQETPDGWQLSGTARTCTRDGASAPPAGG